MNAAGDIEQGQIAPLPRVSIQAFCDTPEIAQTLELASGDRRMEKAHFKVQMGGAPAAVEAYRNAPTPNVILIESDGGRDALVACLDRLSEVCDVGTRVVILGRVNDVLLYRELMRRGVSEYLVAPVQPLDIVRTLSDIFRAPDADPVGRVIAFVGARGGVGSSTLAHNVSWSIARELRLDSVVVDLDLAFGTAGLDFNQDPPQGVAEAIFAPDRLDANLVDRLLAKCAEHLSLLAAPASLDRVYDVNADAADGLVDILRANLPCVILDMPHQWSAWTRKLLVAADEIVVVAEPDLANLRNAKNLIDVLRAQRPNDAPPRLVFNKVGVPKRPEIKVAEFGKALEMAPLATVAFDPHLFGTAANNGQMIAEMQASHKVNETFADLARHLTGKSDARAHKTNLLQPLIERFQRKRA